MGSIPSIEPHRATVKIRNIAAIPDTLREFGADPDVVLRRAGLGRDAFDDPESVLSFAALDRLVSCCVQATGREDFGLRVGEKTGPTGIGLTGILALHSPTVRDALLVISSGLKTSDTGGTVILGRRDGVGSFGYVVVASKLENEDQIVDGAMAIAFNIMRSLCGPSWRPDRVQLTRDPPRDKTPFSRFFAAPIDYGRGAGNLEFDGALFDAPARGCNPDYAAVLTPLHEDAVAQAPGDFVSSIRSVLRARIGAGAVSRDDVCQALGLNPRSLARRLATHGATYSGLADMAKYEAAQSMLRTKKPITEIACILGFAEQSAFTRAFRAWSGTTPARWRVERGTTTASL